MTILAERTYTVEEYFELEKISDVRYEFVYGKLLPMSGESKDANRIALNIYTLLNPVLEPQGFDIFLHDIKTVVEKSGIYRYPDVVIAPETDNTDSHIVTQPVLIAEIISESTARKDRGEKLREYCSLPSLQYYLIIEQSQQLIEMYVRRNDEWILAFFDATDKKIVLDQFKVEIPLEVLYRKVKFT